MKISDIIESKSNFFTKKYLFESGNKTVESIYVDRGDKNIICLSSMYGCPVSCRFCASGNSYYGILSDEEINFMGDTIINDSVKNKNPFLISFMGSGEPLLNIENILSSIQYFSDKYTPKFSISISGVGMNNFDRFMNDDIIKNTKPKLQLSLHSPSDSDRKSLIPGTSDLKIIIPKLQEYSSKINNNVDINYILLDRFNDSSKHCRDLAQFVKSTGFNLKINDYHEVGMGFYESKSKKEFIELLGLFGVIPEEYSTDGVDIDAACGQLVSNLTQNL